MTWIAPAEKNTATQSLEKRLWDSAVQFLSNSASDARSSEQEIRQRIIESRAAEVLVAVGPNMLYTVTLPGTLWFLDKGKAAAPCRTPSPQPSSSLIGEVLNGPRRQLQALDQIGFGEVLRR